MIGQWLVGNHRKKGCAISCAECAAFTDYPDLSALVP